MPMPRAKRGAQVPRLGVMRRLMSPTHSNLKESKMKKLVLIAALVLSASAASASDDIWGADGSYQGWISNGSIYGADGSYQGYIDNNNANAIPIPGTDGN
jgi:hypothetical protein